LKQKTSVGDNQANAYFASIYRQILKLRAARLNHHLPSFYFAQAIHYALCMNILLVKLSSLGDVIQTLPALHDLQHWWAQSAGHLSHPGAELRIDWVVEEAFAPLVARAVGVNQVIPVALRRWRKSVLSKQTRAEFSAFKSQLQGTIYDVIIDGQGLTKSALVAKLARLQTGGRRGSFANPSDACSYEWPVKWLLSDNQIMPQRIHAVARTRLLAAKMLGYEHEATATVNFRDLPARPDKSTSSVFLAHGTTRADNEWALAHWQALAQGLVDAGHQLVLAHSNAHELKFCESLAAIHPSATQILPRMGLSDLLSAISLCSGVIGVDSGLSHMAVALNLPHVQIFSQDRAWRAGPVNCAYQLAVGGKHTPGVEEVWQAWQTVTAAYKRQDTEGLPA
jgi:heptosyltransferase-1